MMNISNNVNRPPQPSAFAGAPLRNLQNFAVLVDRVVNRHPELPGIVCFHGPSGYGKSKSAIATMHRYRPAYVECGPYVTAKSLLTNILTEYQVRKPKGTIEELINMTVHCMQDNVMRPLIVDDAQYVAARHFVNVFAELQNKSNAPIVLIGEETLPNQLERYDRVHNRILEWLSAVGCDKSDFDQLLTYSFKGLEIEDDLAEAILRATGGNTRRIVVNLSRAQEISRQHGDKALSLDAFGGERAINVARSFQPRRTRA